MTIVEIDPAKLPSVAMMTPRQLEPVEAPRPMKSLIASAERITTTTIRNATKATNQTWQDDAWEMYDLVGELRFLANTLAGQSAKAPFYVGTVSSIDQTEPPVPTEDTRLKDALEAIGDGPVGFGQLIKRAALNLYVPGDVWLVGIPQWLMDPEVLPPPTDLLTDLDDFQWRTLSVNELKMSGDRIVIQTGPGTEDKIETEADNVWLVRIWQPHPRRFWEADSPTRSSLPVLRELVGLTMHIGAQIDSRLAGAGILVVPESVVRSAKRAAGLADDAEQDPFTDSLIEAMMTPIRDRSSASAYVPLVITVGDDAVDKVQHITFAQPLDGEAKTMRDEAIRRFALGADAPPEVLLGMGDSSHWNAWLVSDDTVRTHIEPTLALLADALTTQYLRPIMREMGVYTDAEIDNTVVWYDPDPLISRPSRGQDATNLHQSNAIGDAALRDAYGFSDDDAPDAFELALQYAKIAPGLMSTPGLPLLVQQIQAMMDKKPVPLPDGTLVDGAKTVGEQRPPTQPTDDMPSEDNATPVVEAPTTEGPSSSTEAPV